MLPKHTFPKKERLSASNDINSLFHNGRTFKSFPLQTWYAEKARRANPAPVTILIAVPKKRIRHAVERNRIKRLIRESYRLNKQPLNEVAAAGRIELMIAFVYIGSAIGSYAEVEDAVKKTLSAIKDQFVCQP